MQEITCIILLSVNQDAIDNILDLSRETEHPRTYEVAESINKDSQIQKQRNF